ncbi:MAG: DUF2231 domain-containing protein [Nocardioides sp.]
MFDTIGGLPIHPLVVHAAVVLGPLAALLLLGYAFRPGWRAGLKWPMLLTGGVAALSAAIAASSGEALQHRVDQQATAAARALVSEHAEAGDLAAASLYVLFGAIVVVVFFLLRPTASERWSSHPGCRRGAGGRRVRDLRRGARRPHRCHRELAGRRRVHEWRRRRRLTLPRQPRVPGPDR